MKKAFILATLLAPFILLQYYCGTGQKSEQAKATYLNLNDTVQYVGMDVCRQCHMDIYQSFIQTGMGQSFDHASREKSAAVFDEAHALVYDDHYDFYYKPFWKNDSLYIMEFRLEGEDTTYKRTEQINYIIGSGQHTNSHLMNRDGYVYQAPITFYTQRGVWDMAPGFEGGGNTRFSRVIGKECMTCHNALPKFIEGSENKYTHVKTGIDCERCHGPGSIHVREKMAGHVVDTSKNIDYTIVNPANLSIELQMSLCKRCHLQGVSVLQEGKDFDDFKPGMHLSEVMNVYMPRFSGADDQFIMASHVERLMKSKCFNVSGKLSCITCHNPHKSVKITPVAVFNNACQECHSQQKCSLPKEKRMVQGNNCVSCHMPNSGSIDIPHVAVTDHFIRIPGSDDTADDSTDQATFKGLACLTDDQPSVESRIKAYLAYYEKFGGGPKALDSAQAILLNEMKKASAEEVQMKFLPEIVHINYLRSDFEGIIAVADAYNPASITDEWTLYRIGEAFYVNRRYNQALAYFSKAVELKPLNYDYRNKLGSTYTQLSMFDEARQAFEFILSEQPEYVPALANLGFVFLNKNESQLAENVLKKAIRLDPDHRQAILNLVSLYMVKNDYSSAKALLNQYIRKNPEDNRAGELVKKLEKYS